MKKSRLATLASLGLALIFSPFATAQVDDAAEQFFRGYVMKKDAEKMEADGNYAGALQVYQQMGQLFDTVAQSNPEWQPGMLANRRGLTQQAITRVQARLSQPAAAAATPAPAAPAAALPAQAPAPSMPVFSGSTEAPPPGILAAPAGTMPSLSDVLSQWEQTYRQRMLALETQNNQMQMDLTKWQQWYQWASGEINSARSEKDALAGKSAALEQAIETMKQEVAAGRANSGQMDALLKEKLNLEVEYRKVSQRLKAADVAAKDASQKLADSSLRITSLEKERNELLAERDATIKQRDEAIASRDTAMQERDKLSAQNLGMQTEIEAMKKRAPASDEVKTIMAENERLKTELATAQKQVATLQADATRKDQEIAQLRGQLTTLQTEMTALRQQSASYQTQVAELTLQMKNLQEGKPDAMTPELAKENELLREIVMRQLRSQYRQQQAKDLVLAELQKMEGVSSRLIEQVEELRGSRMTLSPEEEKLFSDPSVREMLGGDSIQGTLIAKVSKSDEPAPAEKPVNTLLDKANTAFSAQKFAEAAALYEDALRTDPKNTTALVGLGYSRQRENKLGEAEAALKKCLTYDPGNELAAFHLGVTHFKQQRWNDATGAFEKGLAKNPKNARARHYLGIISTKLNLLDRAEREFKTALAIDPAYGEAHFNLAVLYATWNPPQWDKAKSEYDLALKKGVNPDEALEKLLKGNGKSVSAR
ncbi:tetratricopeptide repeat protein [Prosthecobacter fusiformis]|uniref:Tetratricopeptide repeat protein n=1 Tax=Prosthecobacter fusiformis TaxID=48464 RepID=A0A4R7SQL1_9BACT|nr:tetratricopeptide repeat protein [Prosthecobacter fusiformis]TDU81542.1 tetratricopeptide repeat protein [Prosthecobacter fusiformis]